MKATFKVRVSVTIGSGDEKQFIYDDKFTIDTPYQNELEIQKNISVFEDYFYAHCRYSAQNDTDVEIQNISFTINTKAKTEYAESFHCFTGFYSDNVSDHFKEWQLLEYRNRISNAINKNKDKNNSPDFIATVENLAKEHKKLSKKFERGLWQNRGVAIRYKNLWEKKFNKISGILKRCTKEATIKKYEKKYYQAKAKFETYNKKYEDAKHNLNVVKNSRGVTFDTDSLKNDGYRL
jgi:hypothetical protein